MRETSLEAYEAIKSSGRLGKLQLIVYTTIAQQGPLTIAEVHAALGEGYYYNSINPRVTELHQMGLIHESETRKCTVRGSEAIAWAITDRTAPLPLTKKLPAKEECKRIKKLVNKLIEENPHLSSRVKELRKELGV